ncbi:MAG: formate dehydrogenase subunit alpha, partial [Anaerolineae bacterium]
MMEYKNILTTCIYCGCGCGINFEVMDGKVVNVLPARDHPVGQGSLCIKGWNAHGFIYHEDRLQTPLVRKDGELHEASWDEAM